MINTYNYTGANTSYTGTYVTGARTIGAIGSATPGTPSPSGHMYQEFGRFFDYSVLLLQSPGGTADAMTLLMKDYEEAKAQYFPHWSGFPEIKQAMTDPLGRTMGIGWYCVAPDETNSVVSEKEENDLWEN